MNLHSVHTVNSFHKTFQVDFPLLTGTILSKFWRINKVSIRNIHTWTKWCIKHSAYRHIFKFDKDDERIDVKIYFSFLGGLS